ncbi:MerR family transcriptional regulator [Microbacterium sp. LWS13-1.2]|uniref:MerR family transcriptional regulator n=1 Tax=Microbacterium sp. LWS13-1.2 TaxID=3135264 RepID=A0AAU6SDY9_9MICO
MTWSTRELAELAGTTVNTIRHYHALGLMEVPERGYNGYKHYGVHDLIRLIRIRRLVTLGVPLAKICEVSEADENSSETLRAVDEELAASVHRLQRSRADIATILRERAPADAPAGFESAASHLSQADTSILHVYTRLFDDGAMADLKRMVEVDAQSEALTREIDSLLSDADDQQRQRLAEQLAPGLVRNLIDYPWLNDPAQRLTRNRRRATQTLIEAVVALYNPAQLDVFARAGALAQEQLRADSAAPPEAVTVGCTDRSSRGRAA